MFPPCADPESFGIGGQKLRQRIFVCFFSLMGGGRIQIPL